MKPFRFYTKEKIRRIFDDNLGMILNVFPSIYDCILSKPAFCVSKRVNVQISWATVLADQSLYFCCQNSTSGLLSKVGLFESYLVEKLKSKLSNTGKRIVTAFRRLE